MTDSFYLKDIISGNRAGKAVGIPSWCTAHPETLRAILQAHQGSDDAILIEATSNQVNQYRGYTGMTPADFRRFVERLAGEAGIDPERILLGGDHLGPNPWRTASAVTAMSEARDMVRAYVEAGFAKIHLDASMSCADDHVLTEEAMAERAADLCATAEQVGVDHELYYVIGTEVPVPGGEMAKLDSLAVTNDEAAKRTFELHHSSFIKCGLISAMKRIVAIVVQPGVDFGNDQVFAYDKSKAATLSASVQEIPDAVFEAHSTDYQSMQGLRDLVSTHFAILKVGPELTFAFREAVVAMAEIEEQLQFAERSNIVAVIDKAMRDDPRHWQGYFPAGQAEHVSRLFGLSDRVRYYWPKPEISATLARLRNNIDSAAVPSGLVSQYAGPMIHPGDGVTLSTAIIQAKVGGVVAKYRSACGSVERSG